MRVTVSRMTACNAELREKAHKTRSGREPDPPKMVSGYYHHMTRIDSLAHQAAASTCPGATVSLAEKREIRAVRSKRGHLTSYIRDGRTDGGTNTRRWWWLWRRRRRDQGAAAVATEAAVPAARLSVAAAAAAAAAVQKRQRRRRRWPGPAWRR
jgi:hypothetical protein